MLSLIHVPYWGHATLLEILWLISGVFATWFTVANITDSWKDRQALRLIKQDPHVHSQHFRMIEVAAKGRLESQAFLLVIAVLIVLTGLVGVDQPNPLGGETTWTTLMVTVALVLIGALTAAVALRDHRKRAILYEMALLRAKVLRTREEATDAA